LDFTTANLDARVTVTRALNTATRVNSSGFVASVNADLPRFDFDPTTLACKGLLIEESRTNAITYSQDFGNAAWVRNITDVNTDVAASPDGTTNADKLIPTATSGVHGVYQDAALVNGTAYAFSGYFKADGYRRIMLRESTAFGYAVAFDLISGTVVGTSSATGVITDAGNGWWRCTMLFTSGWTNTSAMYAFVLPDNGTSYGTATFTGDGTSGVLAYGAQLEAGAFATSYIPTTTTSLTRNSDVVSMTGTNFSSWYNASEGTFEVVGNMGFASPSIFQTFMMVGDANDNMQIFNNLSASRFRGDIYSGGAIQKAFTYTSAGAPTSGTLYNIVLGMKANDFGMAINGNAVSTANSGAMPVAPAALYIGCVNTGFQQLGGWVQKLFYWPQKLTNSEIQAFSK
jgi:hypothetical protein